MFIFLKFTFRSPVHFDTTIVKQTQNNWVLKKANCSIILKKLETFYKEELLIKDVDFTTMVDLEKVCKDGAKEEIKKIVEIMLGCIFLGDKVPTKVDLVNTIVTLDTSTQAELMKMIQSVTHQNIH